MNKVVVELNAFRNQDVLLMAEVTKKTGCCPATIRFYEIHGLIAPYRLGRSRTYARTDVSRLNIIRDLRSIGLGIEQIRTLASKSVKPDLSDVQSLPMFAEFVESHLNKLLKRQEDLHRHIECVRKALKGKGQSEAEPAR